MVRLLKREQKEHGTTTIVVSHNRAFLEAADIVLMINEGKLAYRGDLQGALPMLNDLSACNYRKCVGDRDVGCYR